MTAQQTLLWVVAVLIAGRLLWSTLPRYFVLGDFPLSQLHKKRTFMFLAVFNSEARARSCVAEVEARGLTAKVGPGAEGFTAVEWTLEARPIGWRVVHLEEKLRASTERHGGEFVHAFVGVGRQ